MFKGMVTAVAALLMLNVTVAAQVDGTHEHEDAAEPSMGMAQGMMMGGMMGQGMMGSDMMQMMGQGMGMMATGGPGPAALLRMRDGLELTDEQVGRIEAIQADLQSTMQPQMSAAMSAHAGAAEALQSDPPDFDAYQQGLQAAANVMVHTHVAMARAQVEAREVLTADQREHLETSGTEMMQGMMQGMMQMHGAGDPTGH